MGYVVKGKSSIFITDEVTEGTYVAPASASAAIEVGEDFSGFEYTRESIERSVLSNTVESEAPRAGLPTVNGSLPTEFKASATEGGSPRMDKLLKSLLGGKRNVASAVTSSSGHTTTQINLDDADAGKFKVGDSVLVKSPGAHALRPISAVNNTPGSVSITLAFALPSAPADGVSLAPVTTYFHDSFDGTLSVSAELGGDILEKATGCKVESGEIGNWTPGKIPTINFALQALALAKEVSGLALSPDFSAEPQPPVALDAKAFINGVPCEYNEFSLTLTNTLSQLLSCAQSQGKLASRNTTFLVTGSINPYMDNAGVENFEKFNEGEASSIYVHIQNPSSVAGEYENCCAIWLPSVTFTAVQNGDSEGVLTDEIEFQAQKTLGKDTVFMSFI